MLFRKDIEPYCAYCARAEKLNDAEVICKKKGVMPCSAHCSKFSYDPLKRIPPRPAVLPRDQFSDKDFSIN